MAWRFWRLLIGPYVHMLWKLVTAAQPCMELHVNNILGKSFRQGRQDCPTDNQCFYQGSNLDLVTQ